MFRVLRSRLPLRHGRTGRLNLRSAVQPRFCHCITFFFNNKKSKYSHWPAQNLDGEEADTRLISLLENDLNPIPFVKSNLTRQLIKMQSMY